jgi:hypothetical protein
VLGRDRRGAAHWLSDLTGIPLSEQTHGERREHAHARRIRDAEPEARKLVAWKQETLEALRERRNLLQRIYHIAVRFVLNHDHEECARLGDVRYELAMGIGETYWPRVEELDATIDRLQSARYDDLLSRFRAGAVA